MRGGRLQRWCDGPLEDEKRRPGVVAVQLDRGPGLARPQGGAVDQDFELALPAGEDLAVEGDRRAASGSFRPADSQDFVPVVVQGEGVAEIGAGVRHPPVEHPLLDAKDRSGPSGRQNRNLCRVYPHACGRTRGRTPGRPRGRREVGVRWRRRTRIRAPAGAKPSQRQSHAVREAGPAAR
jgi:hypothetical protein